MKCVDFLKELLKGELFLYDFVVEYVCGIVVYIDDLLWCEVEFVVIFVGVLCVKGCLECFDLDVVCMVFGVIVVFSVEDLLGYNVWGLIFVDEFFFVDDEIGYFG